MVRTAMSPGQSKQCGHDIDYADRLIDDRRLQLGWPVEDGGASHSTFVKRSLATAKFSVRGWRFLAKFYATTFLAFFWRSCAGRKQSIYGAAVIAGENNQRIVEHVFLFQRRDDPSNLRVERGDHGRVGVALLIARCTVIRSNIRLWCLIGRMWCERGHIQEQRRRRIVSLDNIYGLVANQCCVVAVLLEELAVALPIVQSSAILGEIVHFADEVAVEVIEAAVLWPVLPVGVAKMP